jgi:hypothetical protein
MSNNQCTRCGKFAVTDFCESCTSLGYGNSTSGGEVSRTMPVYEGTNVVRPRSPAEMARGEHPGQRYIAPSGAHVRYGGHDPDIFDKVLACAAALEMVAAEMKSFSAMDQRTWSLIKRCRDTATDLKMEVEIRRGY